MMLFGTNATGGMMEEGRVLAMPYLGGPSLDLGMSFHRSEQATVSPVTMRRCPVQLDLLPLCPVSHHSAAQSASAPPVSSLTQISRHPVIGASYINSKASDQDGATVLQMHSCSRGASPRVIDMNQIPLSDDDDADISSPNSIISPFHTEAAFKPANGAYSKRERESFTDFDQELDRGCEATSRASDEEDGGMPRKKLRLSKEQSALLEESFKEHSTLNPKQKSALAKQLSLRPRQVEVWFQNRRARTKLKQTEIDCELLKRCCESLTEENRRLQKELQELRAIKLPPPCIIAPDFFMPLPAATLTMCPSCERVAPVEIARPTLLHLPKTAAAAPAFAHFPKVASAIASCQS
ncbi:hypothetical protein O6H91_10G053800 [Diphasiastrum complanatum]|uniref:Uncharacterized protein n=1 Tax=Diphasiastrum complanatum TaxID=34168 RepID=A0ACC2CHE1_DIPCM|nr:hypothetical protein O6H91_10G053800 [Diphasiastrum complanatum]